MAKYRTRVKRRKDQRTFKRTAMRTKRINLAPRMMRGGIRL